MSTIQSRDILPIIKGALNRVDPRLVDHGSRVAFILEKMLLTYNGGVYDRTLYDVCMLGLLHDVGAFKTEDIDDMILFDTTNVWPHAVYGYLFLLHMSPLSGLADAVKYHHLNYDKYKSPLEGLCELALLIKLADRADIALGAKNDADFARNIIKGGSGTKFKAEHIELFERADEKYHILEKMLDNTYTSDSVLCLQEIPLSQEELMGYLIMLALSVDFHSEVTVTHNMTVYYAALRLGLLCGEGEKSIEKIRLGALLHDIGKMAIPVAILEKPSSLTREEMLIMKTHVSITRELLEPYIDPVICKIASRHHERLDGTGYPDGLIENELTVPEQIMAVADVLSALQGARSYKAPFSKEVIQRELGAQAKNGKLSPSIVKVCLENYDSIATELSEITAMTGRLYEQIQSEYKRILEECKQKRYFEPSHAYKGEEYGEHGGISLMKGIIKLL